MTSSSGYQLNFRIFYLFVVELKAKVSRQIKISLKRICSRCHPKKCDQKNIHYVCTVVDCCTFICFRSLLQEWRVGRLFAICTLLPLSHTCRNCPKQKEIALLTYCKFFSLMHSIFQINRKQSHFFFCFIPMLIHVLA